MTGGSFSPGDYAWGQNGLDDIITQVKKAQKCWHLFKNLFMWFDQMTFQLLQTVEGGAPPASRDDVQNLKPEPFQHSMRDKNSQVSRLLGSQISKCTGLKLIFSAQYVWLISRLVTRLFVIPIVHIYFILPVFETGSNFMIHVLFAEHHFEAILARTLPNQKVVLLEIIKRFMNPLARQAK